jgi:hypothetical protein
MAKDVKTPDDLSQLSAMLIYRLVRATSQTIIWEVASFYAVR